MYFFAEEYDCVACENHVNAMSEIKYWMQELLDQFYSTEEFNADDCERSLMEIAGSLGLKIPTQDLQIERKHYLQPDELPIDKWVEWNNKYLKHLNPTI
jgi:hypothetical protein